MSRKMNARERQNATSTLKNLLGIQQGVGATPSTPFGGKAPARKKRNGNGKGKKKRNGGKGNGGGMVQFNRQVFNAFHMSHLPLPRATGPYTVVRTTQAIVFNEQVGFFGPFSEVLTGTPTVSRTWTNACGIAGAKVASAANNVRLYTFNNMAGSWNAANLVPAAFSIQVLNPEALQTTNGVVYIGRARQSFNFAATTRTFEDWANTWLSYSSPRLCAAAKLAMRGVQCDAVPFNMSELSDFRPLYQRSDQAFTTGLPVSLNAEGFAPIVIYNNNDPAIKLQLLVCCEWRVRFDPENPAYATHVQYPTTPDSVWDTAMNMMEAGAHGVADLSTKVAAGFEAAKSVYGAYTAARPMLAAIGA